MIEIHHLDGDIEMRTPPFHLPADMFVDGSITAKRIVAQPAPNFFEVFRGDGSSTHLAASKYVDDLVKRMTLAELVGDVRSPGHPDRLGHYQYTNKGGIFFPCDPRPEEVHIEDIALALSRIPRFNGQTKKSFTVAEHCYIVSHMVPPEEALAALLHDGAEAYIGDMIRPLKYLPVLGTIYLKIESAVEQAIATRFKLPFPFLDSKAIRYADEKLVGLEVRDNISNQVNVNHLSDDIAARSDGEKDQELFLYHWEPLLARQMFLARFRELTAIRGF